MHKFRYLGEYHYAYRRGVLNLLVESSAVYADLHQQHGLPTLCVPWGSIDGWYADLGLTCDIDVSCGSEIGVPPGAVATSIAYVMNCGNVT